MDNLVLVTGIHKEKIKKNKGKRKGRLRKWDHERLKPLRENPKMYVL